MSKDENQTIPEIPAELTEEFIKLLEGKDVKHIEDVIKNLNVMADVKRKEDYSAIYQEMLATVEAIGFNSVHDFLVAIEAQGIIKPPRSSRRKVEIRYQDSDNPENTWTGRGKVPKWLQAYIEQGRKIEEFEIKHQEADADSSEDVEQPKDDSKSKRNSKSKTKQAKPKANDIHDSETVEPQEAITTDTQPNQNVNESATEPTDLIATINDDTAAQDSEKP